jgi:transcription antitermination factor NusG
MPSWFALRVRPKLEKTVAAQLSKLGFDQYVPLQKERRRWSDRVKVIDTPLFPGYIFCRFAYADRLRVLNSPGVESIVGFGKSDAPVEDSEIDAVRTLVASGRTLRHLPFLRIGQQVLIDGGPLAGVRGVVVRSENCWRVVVGVEALERSIAVEVDREVLQTWPSTSLEIAL